MLAIDTYLWIAHGSVKKQGECLTCGIRDLEAGCIYAFSHIRQASGAACLLTFLGFTILLHSHYLQIVVS